MALTPGRAAISLRLLDRIVRGVGSRAGDDGHASGRDFDRGVDYAQPFVVSERGSLAGGAAGHEKIDARFDLPRDQIAQGRVVDGAILMKRSDECSATATELHRNRIARVGPCRKRVGSPRRLPGNPMIGKNSPTQSLKTARSEDN